MIPINLGFITFIVIYIPLILLLLWYFAKGSKYFYKKYYKKEIFISNKLLELKYILAILLLISGIFTFVKEYIAKESNGYFYTKYMILKEDTKIGNIIFPSGSKGRFSYSKSGMHFDLVTFPKPFNFNGILINSINPTFDDSLKIVLTNNDKINGISCDMTSSIKVDYDGILMSCYLDGNNIFNGINMPKGLQIEHYKNEASYLFDKNVTVPNYVWKIWYSRNATNIINDINYSHLYFLLDKSLNIVKFEGIVKTKYFNDKQIRAVMKKGKIKE